MIQPTIGRRVWYWPSTYDRGLEHGQPATIIKADDTQACDAGIAYVHSDRLVNLSVADHNGVMHSRPSVQLVQEGDDPAPQGMGYATWMPYQLGQAKPAETPPPVDNAHVAPGATPFQQQAAENAAADAA